MSSNITGNPTGVVAPMVSPPSAGAAPIVTIPSDGDAASAASVAQPPQQLGNFIAYMMKILQCSLPLTSSTLPQLRFVDSAGNGRFLIDHNGYPTGGRIGQHHEGWQSPVVTPGNGQISGSNYTVQLGASSVVTILDPTTTYNCKSIKLTPSTTSGAETIVYGPSLCVGNTSFMSLSMEFELGLNTALCGSSSKVSVFAGLSAETDPFAGGFYDPNGFAFYKEFDKTVWWISTGNGSTTQLTTTTATPTAGTSPVDRMRLEILGSASAYGAYQARFYINEVLIGTVAAANLTPNAMLLRPMFSVVGEGGAPVGSPLMWVGQVSCYWNLYASGPNF